MKSFADHMQSYLTKDDRLKNVTLFLGDLHLEDGAPVPQAAFRDMAGFDNKRLQDNSMVEKPAMQVQIVAPSQVAGQRLAEYISNVLFSVRNEIIQFDDTFVFYGIINRRGTVVYLGKDDTGKRHLFSATFSTVRNQVPTPS